MANNQAVKLLNRETVTANQVGPAVDLGAFNILNYQIRVHKAASAAGTIKLEHAAVDEDLAFGELVSAVSLTAVSEAGTTGNVPNFLRFVRYKASSDVSSGGAVVSIDIIARET